MSAAYVDASYLVAIALNEPAAPAARARMGTHARLVSANLCQAESLSACARERITLPSGWLDDIGWVRPARALGAELGQVLAAGYLRGADLWHVATSVVVSPDPSQLTFLTLDAKQRAIAAAVGFAT